jgi:osmotically-inducible protein OsmY
MALYGYVETQSGKKRIEAVMRNLEGVDVVENDLAVKPDGWEKKADSELHTAVESQLWWSPYVAGSSIEVTVQNGIVILSGQIEDWDAARTAVKNAYDAGARRVKSRLQYPGRRRTPERSQATSLHR